MDDAIELLTEMMIKEHFEMNAEYIKISKEELINFSIKLLKLIKCQNTIDF